MKSALMGVIGLTFLAIGCNNKEYTRTVVLKQPGYLQTPELHVDLSQIPGDWVKKRTTEEHWGNIEEIIEFDNAHGKRMKVVLVPLDKPIGVK